jgi:hypothetical protein
LPRLPCLELEQSRCTSNQDNHNDISQFKIGNDISM